MFQDLTNVLVKKMLNTRLADTQRGSAPAKFILTAKPVLTKLFFSDILKWLIVT